MSRLRAGALSGTTVAADATMRPLAEHLALLGARVAEAGADGAGSATQDPLRPAEPDLDLALVGVVAADGPDEAAGGRLAVRFTTAFATARDHVGRIRPGGLVLFVLWGGVPRRGGAAVGGISALTRSLALEWAPRGIRVDAIRCTRPDAIADEVAFLASPASRMLTGGVVRSA